MGLSIPLLAGVTHASINVLLATADAQAIHAAWVVGSFDELHGSCKCAEHACNLAYCAGAEMQHACVLLKLKASPRRNCQKTEGTTM